MTKGTKIAIAALVLIAIVTAAALLRFQFMSAAQTAFARATVLATERERNRKGGDNTILILSHSPGGQTVQGRARVDGVVMDQYPRGTVVPICYNPEEPTSIRVAEGGCGG